MEGQPWWVAVATSSEPLRSRGKLARRNPPPTLLMITTASLINFPALVVATGATVLDSAVCSRGAMRDLILNNMD